MRRPRLYLHGFVLAILFSGACTDATLPTPGARDGAGAGIRPRAIYTLPEVVAEIPKCDRYTDLNFCAPSGGECMTDGAAQAPDGTLAMSCIPGGPVLPTPGTGTGSPGGTPNNPGPDLEEPELEPDTCNTGDPLIDSPQVQAGMEQIWGNSNYGENVPMDQRYEDGGWIVRKSDGTYGMEPFPSSWTRTNCAIYPPSVITVPPTAVGWVHTHPFKFGEKLTACPPVQTPWGPHPVTYTGLTSDPDDEAVATIRRQAGYGAFRAYMLDADGITTYTGPAVADHPRVPRCGY